MTGSNEPLRPAVINDDLVLRFDHVYGVAPEKMATFPQQHLPAWDTFRIVAARWDHLTWMHDHRAVRVLGVEELGGKGTGESETLVGHD